MSGTAVCVGFVARATVKMPSKRQSRRGRNFFIAARNPLLRLSDCQSVNRLLAQRRDLALRVAGHARCSRACENNECIAAKKVATESRVGCAAGVADALRCLELHLACH